MAVPVHHPLWLAVVAASFVQQHAEETQRVGSPGEACAEADRYMDEAIALGDVAMESYGRVADPSHRVVLQRIQRLAERIRGLQDPDAMDDYAREITQTVKAALDAP